jgi:hypothetical protein
MFPDKPSLQARHAQFATITGRLEEGQDSALLLWNMRMAQADSAVLQMLCILCKSA